MSGKSEQFEERCSRCRRVAPPPTPGPEGRAAEGWVYSEGDGAVRLICPGCRTEAELDAAWPDFVPEDL